MSEIKSELKMGDVKAIDTMNRVHYYDVEITKEIFKSYEYQVMAATIFKGVVKRMGLKPGEEWRCIQDLGKPSIKEMVAEMDEIGVEYTFVDPLMLWSGHEHRLILDLSIEKMAKMIEESKGRIVGMAGYNPFHIKESLETIDKAVRQYGFKGVWFHPISFGLAPNDKKNYPLYTKCLDLGVPVCMQVGHSAEPMPSAPGHPMFIDEVALDLPDLVIVLTHTGWPWVDEWISMVWGHPNVYGNIGAYYPSGLDKSIVDFMNTRGRDKVFWATNGFGMTRCLTEFYELPLRDDNKRRVLRDNAVKVFKL